MVTKPTPGATGWNVAVDEVIDIANSVADLPDRVATLEASAGSGDVTEAELAAGLATKAAAVHAHSELLDQTAGDNRYILQANANAFAPADATTTAFAALPFRADNVTTTGAAVGQVVRVSGVGPLKFGLTDPATLDALPKSNLRAFATYGDSLTEGNSYGAGTTWPGVLTTVLNGAGTVANLGQGGSTSTEVAIRQGGVDVTLGAFTLPADTSQAQVTVTAPTGHFRTSAELFPAWTGVLTFGGTSIPGTLRHTINSGATVVNGWTFAPTTAAASTSVPAGAVFHCTENDTRRASAVTVGVGRNNIGAGMSVVEPDIAAMIDRLSPAVKRFLVLGVTTALTETSGTTNYTAITALNNALAATYGTRFLDVRRYLIDRGLTVAGLTPTTADTSAIAADTLPPSLLMSDGVHPNPDGYRVMASAVVDQLTALDWLRGTPAALPSVTPWPVFRWDAATLAGADGTAIGSLVSSEAAAGSLVQGTAGKQPTIVTSGGRKWLRFDGVDDELTWSGFSLPQPFTIVARAVFRSLATQPGDQGIIWPSTGTGAVMRVKTTGQFKVEGSAATQTGTGAVTADTSTVLAGVFNGSSSRASVNGAAGTTGAVGAHPLINLRVGYAFDTANRFAAIDLALLRIYNRALTAAEIATVATEMAAAT